MQILSCNLFTNFTNFAVKFYGKWRRMLVVAMRLRKTNRQQMKIITTRTSIKKITNLETTSTTPMTNRRWRRAMATVQRDRADPTTKIRTVSSERKIPDLLHLPTRVRRRAPTCRTLTKYFACTFRSLLEVPAATSRLHLGVIRSMSEFYRE